MEKENVIKDKTFSFAVKIVDLYKILLEGKKEYVMSRQILKSGTSIGANVREAMNAESSNDFVHKLGISQKEADETLYWLELLFRSGYINEFEFEEYKNDCDEILKVIKSIIISMKRKL